MAIFPGFSLCLFNLVQIFCIFIDCIFCSDICFCHVSNKAFRVDFQLNNWICVFFSLNSVFYLIFLPIANCIQSNIHTVQNALELNGFWWDLNRKKVVKGLIQKKTCIYIWNRLSRAFGSLLSTTHFSCWKSVRLLSFETMTVFFWNSKEKQLTHYGITEILFTQFWICIKHSSQCIIWEIQSAWA